MKKTENATVTAMRAGFTLIEILVAVAIIGILGTVATMSITSALEKAKVTAAKEAVGNLKAACTNYYLQNKKYPQSLQDLIKEDKDGEATIEGGEGALEDPWGTEYKYERTGKKIIVISAGPDMSFGTEDDVRSDKIEKTKAN